ncbi:monooxygenase 2-like [Rutidosis leptorrhynchoides]|uniref:monooxygenase 2-like n=1 Tax=Rutidosis leptorrhynchoides TaxID=125765 RepID=UPI003A997B15
MGVGDELRSQYLEVQGMVIKTENGRVLRSFTFKEEDQTQEVRVVERKALLETLAKQLPVDSISYSSKLSKIEKNENGETLLQLANGTQISSKVVIGCDGVRSSVAKWMGFSEPKYVGYCSFRGLANYPDGQPYESLVNYIYGRGIRAAYIPVSPTKVYWFVCFNSPVPGPKITDPFVLKKQTKELIKNWPLEFRNVIDATPEDTIIRTPVADRWSWPGLSPSASSGGVVLVGDAWHPMTPNIGQGGCCALEDVVVLVQKLAPALNAGPTFIEDALRSYRNERWTRVFSMTVRANVTCAVLHLENPVACAIRDHVLVPKLIRLGPMLEYTNFEFDPLLQISP